MPIDFDIAGARKAGATDSDIAEYFKSTYQVDFDVEGARKNGATDEDILAYMNSNYSEPEKKKPSSNAGTQNSGTFGQDVSAGLGFTKPKLPLKSPQEGSPSSGTSPKPSVPKQLTPEQLDKAILKSTARIGKAEDTPTPILRLEELNKRLGTNYTPNQMVGKEPIEEEVGGIEAAGRNLLSETNNLFAGAMGVPRYIERMVMNPVLSLAGMPEDVKQEYFKMHDADPNNPLSMFNAVADYYTEDAKELRKPLKEDYDKSVTDLISSGEYGEAAIQAGVQLSRSLPATMGIVAAASAGVPLPGIVPGGALVFGAENYQNVDPNSTMTETQKQTTTLLKGTVEGVFEMLGTGSLAKSAGAIIEKEGVEQAKKILGEQYTKAIKEALKQYFPITAPIQEGLTEAATTLAQNTIDKYIDPDKKDINVMDGVGDSFVLGGVMGTAFGATPTVVQTVRGLKSKKQAEGIEKRLVEIDADLNNEAVPDEAKAVLAEERSKVVEEANTLIEEDKAVYDSMTPEQQDVVDGLTEKIEEVDKGLASEGLTPTSLEILEKQKESLEKDYTSFIQELETLKENENKEEETPTEVPASSEADTGVLNGQESEGVNQFGDTNEMVVPTTESTKGETVDQKTGSIIPRTKEVTEEIRSNPETEEIKSQLVSAGKIVFSEKGEIQEVKQNSGQPSQLFEDLSFISGDKGVALDEYLKKKDDKGSFKRDNTDWENSIMKDFGRSGKEYTITRNKPKNANENDFVWVTRSGDQKLNIVFNESKMPRDANFAKVKQDYINTLDPSLQELASKNINKLRDLKLHLIHLALMNDNSIEAQKKSLNEVDRLSNIPIAKDYFGEPMIFMHAGREGITEFSKPGEKGYESNDPLTGEVGIYFSRDIQQGQKYAKMENNKPGKGKDIYYTFLKIKNPYYITDPAAQAQYPLKDSVTLTEKDRTELEKLGYDSIIWDKEGSPKHEIVVFDPKQVEIIGSYNQGLLNTQKSNKPGEKTESKDKTQGVEVNEVLTENTDDFTFLQGLSENELSKRMDVIREQQDLLGKEFQKNGKFTKEQQSASERLAKQEEAIINERESRLDSGTVVKETTPDQQTEGNKDEQEQVEGNKRNQGQDVLSSDAGGEAKTPPVSQTEKRKFTQQFVKEYPALEGAVSDEAINYKRLPNKVSLAEANALIDYLGEDEARKAFSDINNGIGEGVRMTMGQIIIKRMEANGQTDEAIDLLEELTKRATDLGQGIQALSMFQLLSPEGQLRMAQREVNKQNEKRAKQDKPTTDKLVKKLKKLNEEAADELETKMKPQMDKVSKVEPKISPRSPKYGSNNKIVSKEKYQELMKGLRGKLYSNAIVPEIIPIGIYHMEAGARKFADFSEAMIRDFGKKVKPYLKDIYDGAKKQLIENDYKEDEFSSAEDIKAAENAEKGAELEKQIERAIRTGNKKAYQKAIAELQQFGKETGLWGKYKQMAIDRLKDLKIGEIQKDVAQIPSLEDFTTGLVTNIRQQIQEKLPETERKKAISKPAIEIIADAFKNVEKYREVWDKTKTEIMNKYTDNEMMLESLDAYFGDMFPEPFSNKLIASAVQEQLKESVISVADVVKNHYTVYDYVSRTLAEKLVEKAGLDGVEAQQLADAVQAEFDRIATKKKQQILEKILSKKERAKPEMKGLEEELIRLTNLGAFTDEQVLKQWAEKNGYPKLTAENVKAIQTLANLVQETPEGFKKFRSIEDLLTYQANLKGVDKTDLALAIWYANILSGYQTQVLNTAANLLNSAAMYVSAAVQNPKNARFIATGFIEGLKRGMLEGKETFRTGYSPIRGKVEIPTVLERHKFTGWGKALQYHKYVGRLMKAADVVLFEAQKGMRAYQLAAIEASKHPELLEPNQTMLDKAAELLGKDRLSEAQEDAQLEYEQELENINESDLTTTEKDAAKKQAEADRKRRVWEIMERLRDPSLTKDAVNYAARGTYNYQPEGVLGLMSWALNNLKDKMTVIAEDATNPIGKAAAKTVKVITTTIVPFSNIIANVANENLNYTPIGALRARSGNTALTYNGQELTPQEKKDLYVKSIMGTSLMVAIYALASLPAGDDDEPLIEITANGTGDYKKNYELKESGWQPYSVKVGKTWFSYQYTPFMVPLSYIGNIKDFEKYRGEKLTDNGFATQVGVAFSSAFRSLMDMTFLSGLSSFLGAASDPRNENTVEDFLKGAQKTATGAVIPNLYTQTAKATEDIFNIPMKETGNTYFGAVLQHFPVARMAYEDKLNALGEPIPPDTDKFISFGGDSKLWDLVADKQMFIGVPSIKSEIESGKIYTQKEYYEFCKVRGAYIKDRMEKEYSKLLKKDKAEAKRWMTGVKKTATQKAKRHVAKLPPEAD